MREKPTYEELEKRVGELEAAESVWIRTEAALRESRNKYQTLFEDANDAIFVASADTGIILDANQKAEQLTGRSRGELIGMHQTALHPKAQEAYAKTAFQRDAKQQRTVLYDDFIIQHKDGRNIPVEISPSFIEVRGSPCVLGIFRDVSEKRQWIETLQRYEAVIKAVTDPVSYVDRDYIYRIVSDAYLKNYSKRRDEIIGHPVWEMMGEDQFENVVRPRLDRCFNGESVRYEDWFSYPDRDRVYYEVCLYPVFDNDGDEIVGASVFLRDHTAQKEAEIALKESEERFRRIVETAEEGIWLVDPKWETEFVNNRMADMLGYQPDEMIGRQLLSFMDEQEQSRARELMVRREQGVHETHEFKFQRRDGTDLWTIVSANAIKSEDGQFMHALAMVTDITDRKCVEGALQTSLAEKEVLLREIHHRVKNNMQAISGLLRMHARRADDARLTEIFTDCRDRIGAMALIHEALYQSENLAKIDFKAYLKKLCRNLARAHDAQRRRIDLTASAADVSMDMDQGIAVGMIIAELISNAFKHAFPNDEGGAVSVHLDREDGENVRLIVSDTGKGLPSDFDIRNPPSLGMRLVVGAVTRELGGRIESKNDGGSVFVIWFECGSA